MVPGDKEGLGSLFPSLLYSHLRENLTVVKKEEKGKYREIDKKLYKPLKGEETEERPNESEIQSE